MRSTRSELNCSKMTKWGQCQQATSHGSELCSAHLQWEIRGTTPDPYYEEKVVKFLTIPTWDWMTESEAHALLNGRYRGDGRRLDQWMSMDPLGVEL
jgi:hypothetical protein